MKAYDEANRIRQLNEMRIQQNGQMMDTLRKSLMQSDEQTKKMTMLLDNFENRLTTMHGHIMPVYEATNILQIKYSNLQKTSTQLEKIIEYYDSVKTLSLTIQAGVGKDVHTYIQHLDKLRMAINYFASNKNQSLKVQNEELWRLGRLNVEREFDQFLSKVCDVSNADTAADLDFKAMSVQEIFDCVRLNVKSSDLEQMQIIIEWFKEVEPSFVDTLHDKIIHNRSEFILSKVQSTLERANLLAPSLTASNLLALTSLANSSGITARRNSLKNLSPGVSDTDRDRRNAMFNNAANNVNLRMRTNTLAPTSPGMMTNQKLSNNNFVEERRKTRFYINDKVKKNVKGSSSLGESSSSGGGGGGFNRNTDQEFETTDCEKFVRAVKKSLYMFITDFKFIEMLTDGKEKQMVATRILERIFDPVLSYLIHEVESIANNAKYIGKKSTSKYFIAVFGVLQDLVEMKPHFLKLFDASATSSKRTSKHFSKSIQSFLEIFMILESSCVSGLKEIIEDIKQDPPTIQPNGNIHPITTETITFIENLLNFDIIAGFISTCVVGENQKQMLPSEVEITLRREASDQNRPEFKQIAYAVESESEKVNYRVALAEYFYKLFRWLNLNLKNKAENYEDQYLKWIFLLNNSYKMSKLFVETNNNQKHQIAGKCKNLSELFLMGGRRDLKTFYDNEILNYKREYSKCWSRLLSYIKDLNEQNPFQDNKLKEKDRQLLKDKFSGFNKEFEDIYETQKNYYIPVEQADLAQMLRDDNIVYVVGQYKRFYDSYSNVNFTSNRDKYLRYTPEMLSARIREFFTAN